MIELLFFSFLTNSFYFFIGKLILNKKLLNPREEVQIFGFIFTSFTALFINFFFPLSKNLNTIFFFSVFIIFYLKKNNLNKKEIVFILISSLLTTVLLALDTVYRPDAALYHLPYVKILNEEKIILGLSNLHFRFGHISIIQYTSAINYNHIFKDTGIIIPLSSICSSIIIYFFYQVKKFIRRRSEILPALFSLLILIYITYKMSRYGEYGNDAPGHFMVFFIIAKLLQIKKINYQNFNNIYLFSIFAFLNKFSLVLMLFAPIGLFFKKKLNLLKILTSFPTFFLFLWLLKNLLVSGCLVYPMYSTCAEKLIWTNSEVIKNEQISGEAWAKDWPNRIEKNISMKVYIENFNWLNSWLKKHFIYILEVLSPYLIICLILFFLIKRENLNNKKHLIEINSLVSLCYGIVAFFGTFIFFYKFPLYRYGYSYLILLIIFLFIFLIKNVDRKKFLKSCKFIYLVCLLILLGKQFYRYQKFYDSRPIIPSIKIEDKKLIDKSFFKIYVNDKNYIFKSDKVECAYNLNLCVPYPVTKLKIKRFLEYKIFYY